MTRIGYRFINWALAFLVGFIIYELARDVNGMEGIIVTESHKGGFWKKDLQVIDLDDSFVYVVQEKDDNLKIGDRVIVKSDSAILQASHPIHGLFLCIFMLTCFIAVIVRTALAADDDWSYRYLKD